jgi:hypothetical protein
MEFNNKMLKFSYSRLCNGHNIKSTYVFFKMDKIEHRAVIKFYIKKVSHQ